LVSTISTGWINVPEPEVQGRVQRLKD